MPQSSKVIDKNGKPNGYLSSIDQSCAPGESTASQFSTQNDDHQLEVGRHLHHYHYSNRSMTTLSEKNEDLEAGEAGSPSPFKLRR